MQKREAEEEADCIRLFRAEFGHGRQISEKIMEVAHASDTPAPGLTATVAPFRAWRGSQSTVAGAPTWPTIELFYLCSSSEQDHSS